jgi:phosphate/sulfate permease
VVERATSIPPRSVSGTNEPRASPRTVDSTFRSLQFISASLYSLGHGGNDAQKTMGIIAVLLFSQGHLGGEFYVPFWVVATAPIGQPYTSGLADADGDRKCCRRVEHSGPRCRSAG